MSLIELDGVTKVFYDDRKRASAKVALESLNLHIEEGEFVSILGPSGCGKTVTLSLIAGFDTPTQGTVTFKGGRVRKPGPDRGVVFQEY
ncbi:MAG: ATP-binding cassette domain-containing protein, partial [Eggerthellaceae bacterium]|nr:ATP-binding cassette domain-containing protein [Eggerthellaceae bacterium]